MATTSTTSSVMLTILFLGVAAFLANGRHVDSGHHRHEPSKGGGDLVAQACVNASQRYSRLSHHIDQKFCESLLRSDKRSTTATHPRDLALIAMDLVQQGAADADAMIVDLGKERAGESLIMLEYCRADYAMVARILPLCRGMVQEYKPPSLQQSNSKDDDIMDREIAAEPYYLCAEKVREAADDCWNYVFDEYVLAKLVPEVFRRATLAKAMIEQMLGVPDIYTK